MADSLFIGTEDLKDLALIQENVDDKILEVVTLRVQKAVVRPILGTAFYKRLSTGIADDDLTAKEVECLEDYIQPLMACACDRKSVKALTYKIMAKTAGKAQDEHIQAVSESESVRLEDDITEDIDIARDDLIGYLCDNIDEFATYKTWTQNSENRAPFKKKGGANTVSFI